MRSLILPVITLASRFNPNNAFTPSHTPSRHTSPAVVAASSPNEIDVSDLGLTLSDLEAPLPQEMFAITTSGTESTSRIPSVQDDGCLWEESPERMDVTLSIPGLRGQPPSAMSLDMTKNTATITAFGMAVWSCILRGNCDPKSVSFSATEGNDRIPLIELSVEKAESDDRWGGFIAQIGEDSIL